MKIKLNTEPLKKLKCERCLKKLKANKMLVCERCYTIIQGETNGYLECIKDIKRHIKKGFDETSEYLDSYASLIFYYKILYTYQKFVPGEIIITPPTLEMFKSEIRRELKDVLDDRLSFILHKLENTGDILYVKQLQEFKEAIEMFTEEFPWLTKRYDIKDLVTTIKMYQ